MTFKQIFGMPHVLHYPSNIYLIEKQMCEKIGRMEWERFGVIDFFDSFIWHSNEKKDLH